MHVRGCLTDWKPRDTGCVAAGLQPACGLPRAPPVCCHLPVWGCSSCHRLGGRPCSFSQAPSYLEAAIPAFLGIILRTRAADRHLGGHPRVALPIPSGLHAERQADVARSGAQNLGRSHPCLHSRSYIREFSAINPPRQPLTRSLRDHGRARPLPGRLHGLGRPLPHVTWLCGPGGRR